MKVLKAKQVIFNVLLTGALLGFVSGLMSGLTRSPISAVAITGLLGFAAATVGIGADSVAVFKIRWTFFSKFTSAFILAFVVSLVAGTIIKNSQPSSYSIYVQELKKFNMTEKQIAVHLTKIVSESPDAIKMFDDSPWIFYNGSTSEQPAMMNRSQVDASICSKLRPPKKGYASINVIMEFENHGAPFSRIAKFVRNIDLQGEADPDGIRRFMLQAGHYGLCRS